MESKFPAIVNHDPLLQVARPELNDDVQKVSDVSHQVAHVPHRQVVLVRVELREGEPDHNGPQIIEYPKGEKGEPVEEAVLIRIEDGSRRFLPSAALETSCQSVGPAQFITTHVGNAGTTHASGPGPS